MPEITHRGMPVVKNPDIGYWLDEYRGVTFYVAGVDVREGRVFIENENGEWGEITLTAFENNIDSGRICKIDN